MIRTAKIKDMPSILKIYTHAQKFMSENGNPIQWGNVYPQKELLLSDIEKDQLYVIEKNENVCAVFAFILGDDPTYKEIEGNWISNSQYGTIHRIAGDGQTHGYFKECLSFCREKIDHIRIDTHEDNHVMRHLIEKNGFKYCGIIHVEDQSDRLAFEWLK